MCGYSKVSEMENEVGASFAPEISDPQAEAVVKMLEQIQPHAAISLESSGVFMRFVCFLFPPHPPNIIFYVCIMWLCGART